MVAYFYYCLLYLSLGIRLALNGTVYINNSVIAITEIGADNNNPDMDALQCITDYTPCCRGQYSTTFPIQGEWHYPNRTRLRGFNEDVAVYFFRTRGLADGTVNMFRRNTGIMNPIGSFCCIVPDLENVNQTLCANIGKVQRKPSTKLTSRVHYQ